MSGTSLRRYPSSIGLALIVLLGLLGIPTAQADTDSPNTWTATWIASPQPRWDGDFALPTGLPFHLWQQTIRQVAKVSVGGNRLRIVVSNAYGNRPLNIGAARVAKAGDESSTLGTGEPLTFSGQRQVSIPPGARMISDPASLAVDALDELAISLYLPDPTPPATFHWDGRQTAYIGAGDQVDAVQMSVDDTLTTRLFLSALLVERPDTRHTVVAFGDSITDGNASTTDANHRWPDYLAERFADESIAVLNAGISGARLLRSKMGENALARFERDVLGHPGVDSVIVLMGINDIGWPGTLAADPALPTAERLIGAYRQLIARARLQGVRIIGATLLPFKGALDDTPMRGYYSAEKEALRQRINTWIRDSGEFDDIVDFDAMTRDPDRPARLHPEFDSGDHLHPNDAGYEAMAEIIEPGMLLGTEN
ncbi:SGNH/GDSL hydrolase family protein [Halomonas elongata]|uniref:SGNH/GDSL hydrolase family protein n=1 Tax=Halomonas elongata TaxID=2746 RepID=UPI004034763A